jgi:hypothetical protein
LRQASRGEPAPAQKASMNARACFHSSTREGNIPILVVTAFTLLPGLCGIIGP